MKKTMISTIMLTIVLMFSHGSKVNAADGDFSIAKINDTGIITTVSKYDTFENAKNAMSKLSTANHIITYEENLSPNKVVALQDGGSAQSYPFRNGVVNTSGKAPEMLAYIYKSSGMTGDRTYVSAYHQMKYHETIQNGSGQLLAKVSISGFTGYVDLQKIDLIPYLALEKGFKWSMGGNEAYYTTPKTPYEIIMKPDSYSVKYNSTYKLNELNFDFQLGLSTTGYKVYSLGVAPSWLKEGKYYSPDGITFYTDIRQTNIVKTNDGKPGRYINYFQFLPLRSKTNLSGDELDAYVKAQGYTSSVYADLGDVFIENGLEYGMNPLLVHSMANLESAFGTSKYAKDRYNLFGWGAIDSDPDQASDYEGVSESVEKHMAHNLRGYTSLNDWRFNGYSVGNKGSGFNVFYASDPYWGMKIASIAYRTDRANGFKDLEAYELGQITDNTAVNVRSSASSNAGILYKTHGDLSNQFITMNKKVGDFYETYSAYPIVNGEIVTYKNSSQDVQINIDENLAYIHSSLISPILKHYKSGGTVIPITPEIEDPITTPPVVVPPVNQELISYRVTASNLNVRTNPVNTSQILGVLEYDSRVFGFAPVNGWVEITYENKQGFISATYLEDLPNVSFLIGDGNRDGKIDMQDYYKVGFHIIGKEIMNESTLKMYDVNSDGKVDMQDYYSVSFHILGTKKIDKMQGRD